MQGSTVSTTPHSKQTVNSNMKGHGIFSYYLQAQKIVTFYHSVYPLNLFKICDILIRIKSTEFSFVIHLVVKKNTG